MIETTRLRWRLLWLALGWLLVAAIVYLSLAPVSLDVPAQAADKVAHAVAYAALTLWFTQIYEGRASRFFVCSALLALGVGLEFVQGLSADRTFEYGDMAADALGIALGWLAAPPRLMNFLERIEACV